MKKIIMLFGFIISFTLIGVAAYLMFLYEKPANTANIPAQKKSLISYLVIEINPSFEIGVDENNRIQELTPLNEEAVVAASNLSIVGDSLDQGLEKLVDTTTEMGYLNETENTNALTLIDVEENTDLKTDVEETLENQFTRKGLAVLVLTAGLNEELKTKAETYEISYGKMLLVNRLLKLKPTLVEADLVKLSVKEIQSQIKAEIKILIEAKKVEHQTKKQELITAAKAKREAAKQALFVEKEKELGRKLTEEEKAQVLKENFELLKADVEAARIELRNNKQVDKTKLNNIRQRYIDKKSAIKINNQ